MHFIFDYYWLDVMGLAFLVAVVYLAMESHTIPELRADKSTPPAREDREMRDLGFNFIGSFDATMNPQVPLHIWVYLSGERRHAAVVVNVSNGETTTRIIEFHSDLLPHGNISTGNARHAPIFYYPPEKTATRAPWKNSLMELFELHRSLCETAWQNGFQPSPIDPDCVRENILADIRRDFEYQVGCGRLVRVSENSYRLSLKGAIIGVPRVWLKTLRALWLQFYRPSNEAQCRRLARRLQKARLLPVTA